MSCGSCEGRRSPGSQTPGRLQTPLTRPTSIHPLAPASRPRGPSPGSVNRQACSHLGTFRCHCSFSRECCFLGSLHGWLLLVGEFQAGHRLSRKTTPPPLRPRDLTPVSLSLPLASFLLSTAVIALRNNPVCLSLWYQRPSLECPLRAARRCA